MHCPNPLLNQLGLTFRSTLQQYGRTVSIHNHQHVQYICVHVSDVYNDAEAARVAAAGALHMAPD